MYCVIITSTYSINIDQFFWYMITYQLVAFKDEKEHNERFWLYFAL